MVGSFIEFNDTLQITTKQGFPSELDLESHLRQPLVLEDFERRIFSFYKKPNMRIYHPAPTRVFLVHNIEGKWLHWGKIYVIEQTINANTQTTSGKYQIVQIYEPEYMRMKNIFDVDQRKRYWDDNIHKIRNRSN